MDHALEIVLKAKDVTQGAFKSVESNLKSVTKNVFSFQTAIAGAVTGAVAMFTTSLIKSASDLQEVNSKFSVVFKGQEATVNSWAENLVDNYAMSTIESRKYLSSIQDLLVPMGMQAEAAGRMSNEIVKLAADLGSFNNLKTEDVMVDITAALTGSSETMKKYGIVINESTIQQKALSLGLAKTKDEITAADKAQASFQMMLEMSSAAIGDMARTSDGYANQLKKLNANVEDFKARLGEELLPVATQVVTAMNDWIKANDGLINQKIDSYVDNITTSLKKVWGIASYDPAILEFGLVGLIVGGKKGAILGGAGAHFYKWAQNLSTAFELAKKGVVEFKDIATANFTELDELVKKHANGVHKYMDPYNGTGFYTVDDDQPETRPTAAPAPSGWKPAPSGGATGVPGAVAKPAKIARTTQSDIDDEMSDLGWGAVDFEPTIVPKIEWRGALDEFKDSSFFTDENTVPIGLDLEAWRRDQAEAAAAMDEFNAIMTGFSLDLSRGMRNNMSDIFYDGFTGQLDSVEHYAGKIFSSIASSFADMLADMVMRSIMANAATSAAGSSGMWAMIGTAVASIFMADGGTINEHVVGVGTKSGRTYHIGESGPEMVVPLRSNSNGSFGQGQPAAAPQDLKISVNLVNKSGQAMATTKQSVTKSDIDGYIINVVLDAAKRNVGGFRDLIGR